VHPQVKVGYSSRLLSLQDNLLLLLLLLLN
jgi:hypothetical protein